MNSKLEPNTKRIACPVHNDHAAILYCHPHKLAGIWECTKEPDLSDVHQHDDYEIEMVEDWPTGPDDTPREHEIYVCGGAGGCGVMIEDQDPATDRHDAIVDAQINEMRGK